MQGAQSGSRLRGIGRYTLSLAKAIVRNRGQHEVFLILNDLFPESVNDIREAIKGILPKENILLWYAPGPTKMCEPQNIRRQKIALLLQTYFKAQEFLALPAEKMSVVYNACDDVFRPITLTEAERAAFMINVFFTVGEQTRVKSVQTDRGIFLTS
ncbi:hypothetical protein CHS0354_018563 [Potamilus streckersoni]|uniref:Uncharacterized protein n=1 Tax=Potamilus streckersoni TaxID=2493646 RepID=A0AAE0TAU3_9BIVA|nr:hypothetical protein CHS0354_018563 [Potamilus streckersoni]